MQKVMNFNIVTIVSVKRSDYRILFLYMSKNDTINILKDSDLNEKNVSLSFFFFVIYKNEWNNLLSKKQRCYNKHSKRLLKKIIKKD